MYRRPTKIKFNPGLGSNDKPKPVPVAPVVHDCDHPGCTDQGSFGFGPPAWPAKADGQPQRYCGKHKGEAYSNAVAREFVDTGEAA